MEDNTIEYIWYGSYDKGTAFSATYRVNVPIYAVGNWTFNGWLEYYLGKSHYKESAGGDSAIEIISGILLKGETGEVNCSIEPFVLVTASKDGLFTSTISDRNGNYSLYVPEFGNYTIEAWAYGYKNESQSVTITEYRPYIINFRGETGLVPEDPSLSYVLECINHWLYPADECGLSMSKVLEVINAWLY